MYADANLTDTQKRFYGMISNVDDNIGKLLKYLETSEKLANTILVFTTDNGTAAGIGKKNGLTTGYNANLRGTKSSPYEGGHRVPFLIHWPKGNITSKNQKKSNDLVAHVDILPTFAALCKLEYTPKNYLDGTDVSQVFQSNTKLEDRMLVVDTQRLQWPVKDRNSCVMQGEWRLVNGDELYNIETDISQTENLSDKFPERVKNMQAFYDEWWKSTEADMHYASIPLNTPNNENVLLTIHDLHSEDPIPWNQDLIRKGELSPKGYYLVRVEEDGLYQFKLGRYPQESNLNINETTDAVLSTINKDGLSAGVGKEIVSASVTIGKYSTKVLANGNSNNVQLNQHLKKGSYNLSASFTTEDDQQLPAYYISITKK